MGDIGVVRRADELGRVVIPIEIRNKLEIKEKDKMEIYTQNDKIVLKKVVDSCKLCDNTKKLREIDNNLICENCINKIKSIDI